MPSMMVAGYEGSDHIYVEKKLPTRVMYYFFSNARYSICLHRFVCHRTDDTQK